MCADDNGANIGLWKTAVWALGGCVSDKLFTRR